MKKTQTGKDPRNIRLPSFTPLEVDMDEHHSDTKIELDSLWDGETIENDTHTQ